MPSLGRITWNYSLVHALFYPALCAVISFAPVYLLAKGFTNAQYGILMGLSSGLVVLLQPTLAALADSSRRVDISRIILAVIGTAVLAILGLLISSGNQLLTGFLYLLLAASTWVLVPLINALCVWFVNRGVPLNFGLSRGIGSLSFAVMSTLLGKIVAGVSEDILLYIALVLLLSMGTAVFAMRVGKYDAPKTEFSAPETRERENTSFFRRYRLFCIGLLGWALIFLFFRLMHSYIYQILGSIGGDSADLGVCLMVASLAETVFYWSCSLVRRRISDVTLMKISACAFVLQSVIALLAPSVGVFCLAMGMQMISSGIYFSTSVYYANQVMGNHDKSKGQAMMTITGSAAAIGASFFGGWLLTVGTVSTMLTVAVAVASVGALVVILTTRAGKKTVNPAVTS